MGLFKTDDRIIINGKLYKLIKKTENGNCKDCPFYKTTGSCHYKMKVTLGLPIKKYKDCNDIFSGNVLSLVSSKIDIWKYVSGG